MKLILAIFAVALGINSSTGAFAKDVSITSLNIRFYGQKSWKNEKKHLEQRDESIREYMDRNNLYTDVIVFQEILDIDRLETEVVGEEYRCVSYNRSHRNHLHVVICHKPTVRFLISDEDDNYIIEGSDLGRYRPAVHGVVADGRGKKLFHLVGLHLKAGKDDEYKREQQVDVIADYLANETINQLPMVITGDFNTNASEADDQLEGYNAYGLDLYELDNPNRYTFRVPEIGFKFDRFFVSEQTEVTSSIQVAGPCNSRDMDQVATYNEEVSDHCAITVRLKY